MANNIPERDPQEKDPKTKKRWIVPLVIAVVAVSVLVVCLMARYDRQRVISQYESDSSQNESGSSVSAGNEVEPEDVESTGLTESEENQIQTENEEAIAQTEVTLPDGVDVYNILLVGVDRRDSSWNGNADSIILMSINKTKERITLMSFMRDLYANVPGHGVRKINSASAYGGADLLVETLEENYKVQVDSYIWVDFESMIEIVDIVGGVDLTLSDAEAEVANRYIKEMCGLMDRDPEEEYFSSGGTYHCDGMQTVAYGRIRYVGNADYQRTERQRTIMRKILNNAAKLSTDEVNELAIEILPLMHNGLSSQALTDLLTSAPTLFSYDIVESRVPYDGHFTSVKEILNPDMAYTIERIQDELYGVKHK